MSPSTLRPGAIVSSTHTANLVQAAEKSFRRSPLRRKELIQTRLAVAKKPQDHHQQKVNLAQQALERTNAAVIFVQKEVAEAQVASP